MNSKYKIIDTLILTIYYDSDGTKLDVVKVCNADTPTRRKMLSAGANFVNLQLYKPKSVNSSTFQGIARNILSEYGFDRVTAYVFATYRSKHEATANFLTPMFEQVTFSSSLSL